MTDHYKHYHQADSINELPLLHMELDATHTQFNLKLKGDPVIVSKMIMKGMETKQDICAAFIAAVVFWCKENNIDPGELKNMVKFH